MDTILGVERADLFGSEFVRLPVGNRREQRSGTRLGQARYVAGFQTAKATRYQRRSLSRPLTPQLALPGTGPLESRGVVG